MSYECVLKCGKLCTHSDTITENQWESLQLKTQKWSGLDKFGDVYNNISWKDGPKSYYMHKTCYISISSADKLAKAQQRNNKQSDVAQCSSQRSSSEMTADNALCADDIEQQLPPKRLRSSVCGPLHDATKCVWCMQGEDSKHPNRTRGKLFRLNTHSAWRSFKRHTVHI